MGALQRVFRKYLPDDATEKDQAGGTLARLKGLHEMLADTVEATKDLDIVEALAKASPWAEAVGKSLGDALPPVRFLLKLFEEITKVEDPGELGYLAATLAYQRAVEQALPEVLRSEAGKKLQAVDPKVRGAAIKELRAEAPPDQYDFERFSFDQALNSKFIEDAERFLETSTRGLGFDESAFLILQNEVRHRFVPNLKGILSHGSTRERFAPFRELMVLGNQDARAYDALLEHADFQRWLFEEQPVLGREPFSLAQVYTETDCGLLRWEEIRKKGQRGEASEPVDPFNEKYGGRHPLVETVLDLLAERDFRDAIVLQGIAGSGKSSLTLRLAWELVQQGLRPIRIELKHLDSRESAAIEEALPEAVHLTSHERDPGADALTFGEGLFLKGSIFNEHVLFRGTKICPYILILDGWDEISVGASEGYQQRVERMLEGVRREFLEPRAVPVRVIITGRPTQAIEASKFLRDATRILTVRNFSPDQLENYVQKMKAATSEASKKERASWSLVNVKVLPKVLERYRKAHQAASRVRGSLGDAESLEILGLPLLAHLALRLLAERPDKAEQILENTTTLYHSLVDLVVGQAGKPEEARSAIEGSAMVTGAELRELLRGTAEAMTTFGAESIPHDELAIRLEREDKDLSRIVDSLSGEHVLSRLMISFFFKGGRTELGAEFSHKSFREYLFAEQVVEVLKDYGRVAGVQVERPSEEYWKDFGDTDPRRKLCHRLAELLGPVWVTREVASHLRRLLAWEIGRAGEPEADRIGEPTSPLSLKEWQRVRDGLADAWDWWGEGVHLRPQPTRETGHWHYKDKPLAVQVVESKRLLSDLKQCPIPARTTTVDAHLGDGLLLLAAVVHAELVLMSQNSEDLWNGGKLIGSPRRYQVQLVHGQKELVLLAPSGPSQSYFFNYCARINAAGYRPLGIFPAQADLRVVDLGGAYLGGVYLSGTNLRGANLRNAYLDGADLNGADLNGAYLGGVDLRGADLRLANLGGAYLRGANFDKTDLGSADLGGADLGGTNLSGADFSRANLRGAYLREADLRGAYLREADLRVTDLRETLVDPEQLELAYIDE